MQRSSQLYLISNFLNGAKLQAYPIVKVAKGGERYIVANMHIAQETDSAIGSKLGKLIDNILQTENLSAYRICLCVRSRDQLSI